MRTDLAFTEKADFKATSYEFFKSVKDDRDV